MTASIGALALVLLSLSPQQAPPVSPPPAQPAPAARIKIDIDRTVGEIDPLLFGNFAEHLGRMIYGGVYEEGSLLSDAAGYRKDVLEAVNGLDVSILRWPGGNFVSSYKWKDGIGPKDQRPARLDLAWNAVESNRFGTDEFLRYAEMIGAEPYIAVNLGLGSINDAWEWVEYTNSDKPTFWAEQRRKNGRAAPWHVKYWALGNEIDGPWQMGHKNVDDYSKVALEAAKAMRAVDPSIKLVAAGSSNYGADWIGWNRGVLQRLRNHADYIAIHTYISNSGNDFERYLGGWQQTIDRYIETTAALIREVRTGANPRPIHIAYDEWNVWYRTGIEQRLEEIYTFEDALAMGVFFNSFFRHADVVKMANIAQMVNVIAPIMANETGVFLQPTYFPLVEYGRQRGNTALDVWWDAPSYAIPNRPVPAKYLDVSASYDRASRRVFVNVLNRSKDQDLATTIESQSGTIAGEIEVWELNHHDLKATHTFGDDRRVRPIRRRIPAAPGSRLHYVFPAHSLTILTFTLQ